jgi:flagellar P-ring protein FlgI
VVSRRALRAVLLTAALACRLAQGLAAGAPSTVRIKDIACVSGTTGQKLIGYGLVVGLEATGDSSGSLMTAQAMANLLEAFDLKVVPADMTMKNVAAVVATVSLPPSARVGDRCDVTIASIGDATSLAGGVLLPTPLRGDAGDVAAMAQGPVSIGGYSAAGGGQKAQKNHPLTARLVDGATVSREVAAELSPESIHFTLREPDFTTAERISEAINLSLGEPLARPLAAECVEVKVPPAQQEDLVQFISSLEGLPVISDSHARIVVNERTGTIIIGDDVRLMPVAIAHGSLTITVARQHEVSQPPPFSGGTTVVGPGPTGGSGGGGGGGGRPEPAAAPGAKSKGAEAALPGPRTVVTTKTTLDVQEAPAALMQVPPPTCLRDLVEALNALGVKPLDLIAILQALKAAGALQAELVLM